MYAIMLIKNVYSILFIVVVSLALANDCWAQRVESKSPKREKVVDDYLTGKFSVNELLELNFLENEITEKDVYGELYNYYMYWAEQKRRFKRNPQPYLLKADSVKQLINNLNNDFLFYKITMLQTRLDTIEDPFIYEEVPQNIVLDTVHYGIFYFDGNDSLINVIHYK